VAVYKANQVLTASPVERVVLLYRGAIRFANEQASETELGNRERSHRASMRAQEIVSALRETLDLSAGPVAGQLDGLYAFCLDRLMDGNIRRDARPVREATLVLQGLLEAWQQIASSRIAAADAPGPGTLPVGQAARSGGAGAPARVATFSGALR
jgi:flagellar secretion chaperone FliS